MTNKDQHPVFYISTLIPLVVYPCCKKKNYGSGEQAF